MKKLSKNSGKCKSNKDFIFSTNFQKKRRKWLIFGKTLKTYQNGKTNMKNIFYKSVKIGHNTFFAFSKMLIFQLMTGFSLKNENHDFKQAKTIEMKV